MQLAPRTLLSSVHAALGFREPCREPTAAATVAELQVDANFLASVLRFDFSNDADQSDFGRRIRHFTSSFVRLAMTKVAARADRASNGCDPLALAPVKPEAA